jgi:hypothetical protein
MNWKIGLDKYLTSPPDDGFDDWCETVVGHEMTDEFYHENTEWIEEPDKQCNKWLNELFWRDKSPCEAAEIIERAFRIYCKQR